jgi:hypothetical protein
MFFQIEKSFVKVKFTPSNIYEIFYCLCYLNIIINRFILDIQFFMIISAGRKNGKKYERED